MVPHLSERIYYARQPIFSPSVKVVAYQVHLLGRVPDFEDGKQGDEEARIAEVIGLFENIDWKVLANGKPVVVRLTPSLIRDEVLAKLPPLHVVVGVDWRIIHDPSWPELYKLIKIYHFPVALSKYDFSEPLPFDKWKVDYVIVDIQLAGPQGIISHFPGQKDKTRWIADKVHTHKQFEFCRYYGFKYFEGDFYLEPRIIEDQPLKPNQIKVLQLLRRVEDPNVNLNELVAILEEDIVLSEQVVRLANQFEVRNGEPIHSIMDAVRRLGLRRIKEWLQTIAITELGDKSPEVVRTALVRAAFGRCIARILQGDADVFYTVGLFSLLDVLMDRPMGDILRELKLDPAIIYAIGDHEGAAGITLQLIKTLESGGHQLELPRGIVPDQVHKCYLQALRYADSVMATLESDEKPVRITDES